MSNKNFQLLFKQTLPLVMTFGRFQSLILISFLTLYIFFLYSKTELYNQTSPGTCCLYGAALLHTKFRHTSNADQMKTDILNCKTNCYVSYVASLRYDLFQKLAVDINLHLSVIFDKKTLLIIGFTPFPEALNQFLMRNAQQRGTWILNVSPTLPSFPWQQSRNLRVKQW